MKSWKCTQCGNFVDKGIVASIGGSPTECSECGNDEFEGPTTIGTFHSTLDRMLP